VNTLRFSEAFDQILSQLEGEQISKSLTDWFRERTVKVRHQIAKKLAPKIFDLSASIYDMLSATPRPMVIYLKEYHTSNLVGAEIGVAKGENALSILNNLSVEKLFLIDAYGTYYENGLQLSYEHLRKIAIADLSRFSQVIFIRKNSINAAKEINLPLDFIYIDGNHEYDFVQKDIETYYPLIKQGGVIGGHDYIPLNKDNVVRAVNEFVNKHDRRNFYAVFPDWWYIKRDLQ
jgi:hypothetical protein